MVNRLDEEQRPLGDLVPGKWEERARRLCQAAAADLAAEGWSHEDLAQKWGRDRAQVSRILSGEANVPWWILGWVYANCRARRLVAESAKQASGAFLPGPPRSAEEKLAMLLQAAREHDLADKLCAWAGLGEEP